MAKKPPTISKLKKKLDAIYSKYIRQKYSKDGISELNPAPFNREI